MVSPPTLKARIVRAGSWSVAGYAVTQTVRLASSLIMTRLLVPEMFGVMAVAGVVLAVLTMMSDLGLHHNIVQSQRGEEAEFLDTAWVLQIARGVLLWAVSLLIALGLHEVVRRGAVAPGSVYADPVLPLVIAVSGLSAVIGGFQNPGVSVAQRRFEQASLVKMEIASQAVSLAAMIAIGVATRSIWALVAGGLVTSATSVLLGHFWVARHRTRFRWDRRSLDELISFGKWTFVSSIFSVLALYGDRLLLGGLVDSETLGLYAIAALILGAAEGALGRLFAAVSLAALSEIARTQPARLREAYYRLRVPGDVLLLFFGGVLFFVGEFVIRVLYDVRYHAAGPILQILAFSFIASRYNISYHIYLAVGKPLYLAAINFVRFVALFVSVPLLHAYGGVTAAIWGVALCGIAQAPFVMAFNARLGVNDTKRELLVLLALPAGMACGYALRSLLS
jgi:O-antigen/teichoic acid export membrane protein